MQIPRPARLRLDPGQRFALRVTLLGLVVAFFAIPFGVILDQLVREGPLMTVDAAAANHLHGFVRGIWPLRMQLEALSLLGTPLLLYPLALACSVYIWRRGRHRLAAFLFTAAAGGWLIQALAIAGVDRERPSLHAPVATGQGGSFPSGHAMAATVVLGALLLVFIPMVRRAQRPAALKTYVAIVAAIGIARLGVASHYITDVIGGYLLGLVWLVACTAAFQLWRVERGRPRARLDRGLEPGAAKDLAPRAA